MSIQLALHEAHKARLARLNGPPMVAPPAPPIANRWLAYAHEIGDQLEAGLPSRIATVWAIQRSTCKHYEITRNEMLAKRQNPHLVVARHVAFYLARTMTTLSFPEIGRMFNRDHTSIMHGCRKIEGDLPKHQSDIDVIMRMIQ